MYTAEQWADLEQIKTIKHQYCRLADTKQWQEWVTLFTDDYYAEMIGVPRFKRDDPVNVVQHGIKDVVGLWSTALAGITTIHQVMMPEITLTGPTTAQGIWSLHDILYMPTNRFEGWGHYHEDYVKIDGKWKFKKVRTTRLHIEEKWYDEKRGGTAG
jgi:SnoaL-like domain